MNISVTNQRNYPATPLASNRQARRVALRLSIIFYEFLFYFSKIKESN